MKNKKNCGNYLFEFLTISKRKYGTLIPWSSMMENADTILLLDFFRNFLFCCGLPLAPSLTDHTEHYKDSRCLSWLNNCCVTQQTMTKQRS